MASRQAERASADEETRVYVAGVLALTDPGPAAAGVVVLGERDRMLAHRSYYLGHAGSLEAQTRALLAGLRLALALGAARPRFLLESQELADTLAGARPLPTRLGNFGPALHELVARLPILAVEVVSPAANPARAVALAPLVEWLPERTRRAERLQVRQIRKGEYEVQSERHPGVVYRVHWPSPQRISAGEAIRCECPDYQYRGMPCKHLLVVAGEERQRLFYPHAADSAAGSEGIPGGPRETAGAEEDRELFS